MEPIDDARRSRVRHEIAVAGFCLLSQDGTATLTMRSLAARLGVQPSTLYQYVRDRDDVLGLVVHHALDGAGIIDGKPAGSTREVVGDLLQLFAQHPPVAKALSACPDTAFGVILDMLHQARSDEEADGLHCRGVIEAVAATLTGAAIWLFATRIEADPEATRFHKQARSTADLLAAMMAPVASILGAAAPVDDPCGRSSSPPPPPVPIFGSISPPQVR